MIVRAPNKGYNGVSAGVRFTGGVGETSNPRALAYFAKAGYELVPGNLAAQPEPAPEAPTPIRIENPALAPAASPFAPTSGSAPATVVPLERMNKTQLQAIAVEKGLDPKGSNRELVNRIKAAGDGS
jgi:hypothetical protein